ncbi:MAG: hypothetical protein U0166_20025 [Acidobacteriota bacterium]
MDQDLDLDRLRQRLDQLGRRLQALNEEVDTFQAASPTGRTPREIENEQKRYQNLLSERASIERELARMEALVDEALPRWLRPLIGLWARLRRS